MISGNNGNNGNNVFVQITLGQEFVQNNGHDDLIDDFEKWLRKQKTNHFSKVSG